MDLSLEVCKKMNGLNIYQRTEPVIAIGGGVCLDIVGLASSLFCRKTPYTRGPTTAPSYVDASVGAKSGCNFVNSKNRLGAYVPPAAALLDSSSFKFRSVARWLTAFPRGRRWHHEVARALLAAGGARATPRRGQARGARRLGRRASAGAPPLDRDHAGGAHAEPLGGVSEPHR